jgi:hypothetical protein
MTRTDARPYDFCPHVRSGTQVEMRPNGRARGCANLPNRWERDMLMKLARTLGAAVTALVMAGATHAAAGPKVDEARFYGSPQNPPEVRVGAEDGRWVVLKSSGILYRFSYHVHANRPIKNIAVAAGNIRASTTSTETWFRGLSTHQHTAWGSDEALFLRNSRIGDDSARVKAACNDLLAQGKTTAQRHETFANLDLNALVTLRTGVALSEEKVFRRTGTTMVKVVCEAEGTDIKAPPEPFQVDVQVEQKGETCPKKTDVTAIIKYKVPMTATFRFKVDGELSEPITIKARKVGGKPGNAGGPGSGAYYLVKRLKTYHLDPGQHHFRVVMQGGKGKKSAVITRRVQCPPFKITSTTLTYKVAKKLTCKKKVKETLKAIATRPGKAKFEIKTQAGAVVHAGTAVFKRKGMEYIATSKRPNLLMGAYDGDMMADFTKHAANSGWTRLRVDCMEVLSGTLEQRGFAANRCKGEAAFSIRTNGPGKVPYRLECTGGRAWTGKVQAHETGPNTFIGVDTVRFDVENNELVRCALRTRKPLPFKVLAGAKRTYACHKTTGVSSTDDLAPETRPEDPPPLGKKLTGDFSFIDRGGTKCPRGRALLSFRNRVADSIHYSLDCTNGHFSGVAKTAAHPKGGYVAAATVDLDVEKTTQVNCALKTVAPEKKTLEVKGHLFRCVKVAGPVGPSDFAPETRPDSDTPRAPVVVIDPGPQISCAGGIVKKSDCLCPRTHKRVKAGKNAFRCVRKVVVDPAPGGKAVDATRDTGKSRRDAEAKRRRLEALKKQREARKRAAERRKKAKEKAAKLKRRREAAKKKAAAKKRKAAKKAAELRRKRKAAAARRKRKKAKQGQPAL